MVEYKHSTPPERPPRGHAYQAAAYAMLAEEHFGKTVRSFYIYYDDGCSSKAFKFTLTKHLRDHVRWTVRKIRAIIEGEDLPRAERKKKCANCGYYRICRGI